MAQPDWSDLECLLALWVYHRMDRARETKAPINKAALYREIAGIIGRTEKSVEAKVQNGSACDPRPRSEKPISVLTNKQQRLKALFDLLWPQRRHELEDVYLMVRTLTDHGTPFAAIPGLAGHEIAAAAEAGFKNPAGPLAGEPPFFVEEGRLHTYEGEKRNRSSALTEKAREHYRAEAPGGLLRCVVCGISFDTIESDSEIMHLHHLNPIAQVDKEGRLLPLKEAIASLRPVCPNCHGIIHSRRPLLSLAEARKAWEEAEGTR